MSILLLRGIALFFIIFFLFYFIIDYDFIRALGLGLAISAIYFLIFGGTFLLDKYVRMKKN